MKPTLAEALSIFVDSYVESLAPTARGADANDACTTIAIEILETHGAITYFENLTGLDPFAGRCLESPHLVGQIMGSTIRELCDVALWNLSQSGYAHSF